MAKIKRNPNRKSRLFRSYRALRGLSQLDVAEAIGEEQYYVSFLETGKALPPLATAKKICRLLRAPMEELFPELANRKGVLK